MNPRTRTIASFFTVAMAAMLVGVALTSQVQHADPPLAQAPQASAAPRGTGAPAVVGLDTFRELARGLTPGVVNINTKKVVRRSPMRDPLRDFFGDDMMDRFFGPQGQERQTQRALGSGFVIDKDGYILTNRHVVEDADQISVTFVGGKTAEAKLVGRDARTDVALLKIDPTDPLTTLPLGDSDQTEVGEWVMAIGNPFGLGGNSVTVGVISYKGRSLELGTRGTSVDMLQTDASINPGNSGGPLINARGEVVGVNTLIITQGAPQSAGVGFAVAINVAKEILPQLREKGKVIRGWLGVQIQAITDDMAKTLKLSEARGAIVSDVTDDSPAKKAGVEPGDAIVGVDGHEITDNNDLSRYIASHKPGTTVKLEIVRSGARKTIPVTLGTFPDQVAESGSEDAEGHVQLGMTLRDLSPELAERLELPRTTRGAVVLSVEAGEAAESAGLQRGDVIVSVNGEPVDGVRTFQSEIGRAKPDGLARLRVRRGDNHLFLVLKIE
jgi:serine protease Do